MKREDIERRIRDAGAVRWLHRFEVMKGSGVYTPGKIDITPRSLKKRFSNIGLRPGDFRDKRVLDIGTSTGALAFYLEEQGARVVAIDVCQPADQGFSVIHQIRGSGIEFRRAAVYDLNPEDFGYFDVVLFYGVYYHLRHPILALERINSICREGSLLIGGGQTCDLWYHHDEDTSLKRGVNLNRINTRVIGKREILNIASLNELPLCGFSAGQFFQDSSNWFIPNCECVFRWLSTTGFKVEASVKHNVLPKWAGEFNRDNIPVSRLNFKASKFGSPVPENRYQQGYELPTSLELERARMEIKQLEERLAEYESRGEQNNP